MDRYQLVKVVDWAGTLRSRKRMQKVIYLLQAAGCPFRADYILHHYGPYSQEVARLTDELVRSGLLEEVPEPGPVGVQYSYRLSEVARRKLEEYERAPRVPGASDDVAGFEETAKDLIGADLKDLEVAATLAYFQRQDRDWTLASEKTRQFKNLPPGSPLLQRAEALARRVVS